MTFSIKRRKKTLRKILLGVSLAGVGFSVATFCACLSACWGASISVLQKPIFPTLMIVISLVAALKPMERFYTFLFDRYIFRKKNYGHMLLMNLTEELDLVLDLDELSNTIVNTFGEVLQLKTVSLFVPLGEQQGFEVASAFGWHVSDYRRLRLDWNSPLAELVRSSGPHVFVRNQVIQSFSWQEANRLVADFDTVRAGWVMPLFVKEELTGFLAFSALHSDRAFDKADFHFFREFGRQIAKSIRNALRVESLKRLNAELQDAQSQMIQTTKLTAIEQLATGIAHEIHNPLTIISGRAQVLLLQRDKFPFDSRIEEVLKTIVKQTKRAADITRKLLMFSQGSGLPSEKLNLVQVIEDTLALVSYQTALDGIKIVRHFSDELPAFYGNIHELREVFLNLVLNAVQAIGDAGEIQISACADTQHRLIEIRIVDSGKGISEENLDKVFNPFFTTRHNALGLGLFVTKQIVHRYGGAIRVESKPGAGSLLIVRFPLSIRESPAPAAHAGLAGTHDAI